MLRETGELTEPPGAGFMTVMAPVPCVCRSVADSETWSDVEPVKAVGLPEPFHCTMEFDSNPVPVSVIVAAEPGGT